MYQLPDLLIKELTIAIENDLALFPLGWKVHLYVNNLTPTKANVVADFTEMTNVEVPGYAPLAPTWSGTPVRKQDGTWQDLGTAPLAFAASGPPAAPQICYGWFATNAAGTVLIGSGKFLVPFTFTLNGDGFTLEPTLIASQKDGSNYNFFLEMEQE